MIDDQGSATRDPVRTTIVGGQPRVRTKGSLPVPAGIEQLIARAAGDSRFREQLLADREAAAQRTGIDLTESEAMVLRSITDEQLAAIIDNAPPAACAPRRGFLQAAIGGVGGWLAALLGASVTTTGCKRTRPEPQVKGIRPDMPPPAPDQQTDDEEPEDEPAVEEESPKPPEDEPPPVTRGIQPDVPPEKPRTLGIQPDVPPRKGE